MFKLFCQDRENHTSASLPEHTRSAVEKDDVVSSSWSMNVKPDTEHSELLFGFSAELENLVNRTVKEDKDV